MAGLGPRNRSGLNSEGEGYASSLCPNSLFIATQRKSIQSVSRGALGARADVELVMWADKRWCGQARSVESGVEPTTDLWPVGSTSAYLSLGVCAIEA